MSVSTGASERSIYSIDTNAAIALINRDKAARNIVGEAEGLATCVLVIGALFFGAENSARRAENIATIEAFMDALVALPCDEATAHDYGRIRHQLRMKSRPIPENDIWTATLALQHNLTLITRDNHFVEVDGLAIRGW